MSGKKIPYPRGTSSIIIRATDMPSETASSGPHGLHLAMLASYGRLVGSNLLLYVKPIVRMDAVRKLCLIHSARRNCSAA